MAATRTRRALSTCLATSLLCLQAAAVSAADGVNIAGNVSLNVNSATGVGSGLAPDSASTTYSVTNSIGTKKIVGRLNASMPSQTTLDLALAAPSGASSAGTVTLTSSDLNLVTGIGMVVESGLDMTFTFSATVNAGVISSGSRTLTLTLVDAP